MKTAHPISDAALESDIAILGKKGRGKSFTARGLVERLLDQGRRVVVLDPLSTWWGLKAGPQGYPIPVIGGPHADLPLDDHAGAALGRYLATADQSAVIDLGAFRKAELVRFATPFLEELYTHNRLPLWLVLEEADVFAPQQPMPETARMLGEVERIARRGRQFGFKLISLTQRPARLNKDVLTQLSTLVALGITSPQDRDAIKAWVEGAGDRGRAKEVIDSLSSLKVGEGWVWSPDQEQLERVTFPPIKTLDTSATPKAGEKRVAAKVRKDVDVAALQAALATSVSASTDRAGNGSELGRAHQASASVPDLAAAEQHGYYSGYLHGQSRGRADGRIDLAQALEGMAETLRTGTGTMPGDEPAPVAEPGPAARSSGERPPRKPANAGKRADALRGAARKMLAILDTNPPVRRSWQQVATLAGLKARGGHFNAGRKALLDAGLLASHGELVAIAAPSAGASSGKVDPAALVEMWCGVLKGAAPKILRLLFGGKVGAIPTPKGAVADLLGMQPRGGHWNAAWKELRDNGLVVEAAGAVRLSDLFVPAGRT